MAAPSTSPKALLVTALGNLLLQDGSVLPELVADELPEAEARHLVSLGVAEEGEARAKARRTPPAPVAAPAAQISAPAPAEPRSKAEPA